MWNQIGIAISLLAPLVEFLSINKFIIHGSRCKNLSGQHVSYGRTTVTPQLYFWFCYAQFFQFQIVFCYKYWIRKRINWYIHYNWNKKMTIIRISIFILPMLEQYCGIFVPINCATMHKWHDFIGKICPIITNNFCWEKVNNQTHHCIHWNLFLKVQIQYPNQYWIQSLPNRTMVHMNYDWDVHIWSDHHAYTQ